MSMYEEQEGPRRPGLQETAREVLDELGYVWLGDLSGMEVVPMVSDAGLLQLHLAHRCGTYFKLPPMDGTVDDGSLMLGNLVEAAVRAVRGHACPPHQLSPETAAMMERWQAAERVSGPPRMLPDPPEPAPLDNPDEEPPPDPAEPPAGQQATAARLVDGPGCTPAFVPGVLATFPCPQVSA